MLVLDDVFAELDADRREQLALVAAKAEQVDGHRGGGSDVPDQLRGMRFDVLRGDGAACRMIRKARIVT